MNGLCGRLRTFLAVLISAAALVAAPAMGQEVAPEHLALARQYIDLTDRGAIYEVTLVETGIETMRTIVQQNPEIIDQTDAAVTKTLESYRGRKGELLDQFARVYAQRFSMEELQSIVDFYASPAGSKLAQVNSEISTDIQNVLTIFEANLKQEFFAQVRAELRSGGVDL